MRALRSSLLVCALAAQSALATETTDKTLADPTRFGFYEDNFMLFNRMKNNGWAGNDESAIRAHYSLRYVLFGRGSYDAFLSYTGEFDFYMGTRPSGPVINRKSNPALHVRWTLPQAWRKASYADYAEIGIEHSSDGQTTEVTDSADAAIAQRAYKLKNRAFFDQISRGSNFVSVAAHFSDGTPSPLFAHATVRFYLNQDSAVTWGPLAGTGTRLSDYNRLTLRLGQQTWLGKFEAQWIVGDNGFKTDSFELGWEKTVLSLPVYVRLHRGPLNTLSNYTQRQDSIGIGLRFHSLMDAPAWSAH